MWDYDYEADIIKWTENGVTSYYKNNKLHRLTGPAVIGPFNEYQYYIDGVKINSKEEFDRLVKLKAFF